MTRLYKMNELRKRAAGALRKTTLVGTVAFAASLCGCGDGLDDGAESAGGGLSAGGQGGTGTPTGMPGDPGGPGDWPGGTGGAGGPGGPGTWPGGTGSGDWPGGGGPGDWPGGTGPGDWPGGTGPGDWPGGAGGGEPNPGEAGENGEKGEDLRFTFRLPGSTEPYAARVLGGVDGTTVVIDEVPESYGFDLNHALSPMGYPKELDDEYCDTIEGYVESVESGDMTAPMALRMLREMSAFFSFHVRYGWIFSVNLKPVVREAARAAGATRNLSIRNAPKLDDLSFEMTFSDDALARRMDVHEEVRETFTKQFLAHFKPGQIQLGHYMSGTGYPDLLCDLHTRRAQLKITIKEQDWSLVAKSQAVKPMP